MRHPNADDWWAAAQKEIDTLEKMNAWYIVDRDDELMNILKSTWALRLKRFPDGAARKFKGRFCVRGDMQIEGVDFHETWAPVVSWTTVRMMLILECLLELEPLQADVNCAFLHVELDEDENIFVEMPEGFKQQGKVLQLRRNLYGLKQAPRNFYKYTVEQMGEVGLKQSDNDPCLFIGPSVIAVQYVEDLLFWSKQEEEIDFTINNLKLLGVDLEKEGDACGYLGVEMEKDPKSGEIVLTQEGLTQSIIKVLGLDEAESTGKATPAEKAPLTKDEFGEPPHRKFSYASIIGMLLYLAGHSQRDITFAVHQAARFSFCCKRSHELALIRIGRYLKATSKK